MQDSRRNASWRAISLLIAAAMLPPLPASANPPLVASERVQVAESPVKVADFELTDQDGKPFRFSQLAGQPALLFFGFTHCPDICPTTLHELSVVKKAHARALRRVPVVLISVDGDRDSPAALKRYLANFSTEFIGLTGDPRKVRDIAAQFPAVFFKGLPDDAAGNYTVQHTSMVYAIDRRGRVRAQLQNATQDETYAVARSLLKETRR